MRNINKEQWQQGWGKFRDLRQNAPDWYPGSDDTKLYQLSYQQREGIDRLLKLNEHITETLQDNKIAGRYMESNHNKENIVKPIAENSKGYAADNIKSPRDQERFIEAVKEKARETVRTDGTPKLNEQAQQRDSAKDAEAVRKDKPKDIER